eukprot:COSAG06_NODE_19390_length_840_cov_2.024291_2_plen_172_part_00
MCPDAFLRAVALATTLPLAAADQRQACDHLAQRLGCDDGAVATLCPAQCGVVGAASNTRAAAAPPSPPAELPLLFMDPSDIRDTWGHQQLVATPAVDVTATVCNARRPCSLAHPGLARPLQGGLMSPNPLRPAAGYEIFFESSNIADVLEYDVVGTGRELREDPKAAPKSI